MMNLKSCSAKGLIKVYKNSYYQSGTINMLRATSFSSINHNNPKDIHSNKVDAPFATTPTTTEPKLTRRLSMEDPNYEPHNNNINEQGHHSSKTEAAPAAGYVADKAKRGTKGVVETAFNVGTNVAEGMEQTFGAIKDTTKKVKNTVLGEYDDEPGHDRGDGGIDKHVEDLRRKAGGYDQRSH